MEPARGTVVGSCYQTILSSSIKLLIVTLEPITGTHLHLWLFTISILIKQNHQWIPTLREEKLRAELFTYWQERILSCLLMSTESENLSSLRSRRQKSSLWTGSLFGKVWSEKITRFFSPFSPSREPVHKLTKGARDWEQEGKGGEGNLIPWDYYRIN